MNKVIDAPESSDMGTRAQTNDRSRSGRGRNVPRRRGAILRIVLALSLWHAPIPWLHCHDLDGTEVEHTAALSHHVHGFHQSALEHGVRHAPWHAHLLLPWCNETLPCSEGDESPHRDGLPDDCIACRADAGPSTQSASLPASAIEQGADDGTLLRAAWNRHAAAGGRSPLSRSGHFLATSGCSTSLIDLLSARLC